MSGGIATFSNNPNANTGIKLSGPIGPAATPIQGGAVNIQAKPTIIQGSGAPAGGNILTRAPATTAPSTINGSSLDDYIKSLNAQLAAANQKVYAPALDTNAIYSQARTTAAANVNPYYTKMLNDFITQQGVVRGQQEQQTQTNIQGLQDQLAELTAGNAVTGQRATEDTATNIAGIDQGADYRQTDQGTAFDTNRTDEAVKLAGSGLTESGIGAHQQATTQATHDTTETRQADADQHAKDAAILTKARTFEDIATSNTNATSAEGKGEKQAKFDLDKFITGQSGDLQQAQGAIESQRQSALASEEGNQTKILVNNFISSIANPAQRQAAIQTYGAYL